MGRFASTHHGCAGCDHHRCAGGDRSFNKFCLNSSHKSRQLTLNFASIQFEDKEIDIGVTPFKDKDHLRALRQENVGKYLFHRYGDYIFSVALTKNVPVLGEQKIKKKLSENLHLVANLVRNAIINYLNSISRPVLKYEPLEFLSDSRKGNLLDKACSPIIEIPDWLVICPRYVMPIRTVEFDNEPASLGLALNSHTKRSIELTCSALLKKGIDLIGLYVSQPVKSGDPRIAAYSKLLGQVQAVDGQYLRLTDAREGRERVLASEVFLEPRKEAFRRCLENVFREKSPEIEKKADDIIAAFRSGSARLKQLQAVSQHLSKQKLTIVPGVTFSLQPFLSEKEENNLPTIHKARSAVHVFDSTGAKTDIWNDRGLTEYGPYSSRTFTPSTPRICLVSQRTRIARQWSRALPSFW